MEYVSSPSSTIGYECDHHPHHHHPHHHHHHCKDRCKPPVGGLTVLRINIPAGAVINLLNLIELSSPAGICLIVRVPLLGGCSHNGALAGIMSSIRQAGGTVEVVND